MTTSQDAKATPDHEELEITLLGPGYGESVVLHIGCGEWVIVDSCIDPDGNPRSLRYLESIGVNPSEAVVLLVATHWRDDHIRGMEKVVETCRKASFCCSAALLKREFLTVVDAWGRRSLAQAGSGVREIFGVFTHHVAKETKPIFALANRRIYLSEQCEIWALSPSDTLFKKFLVSIGGLLTAEGQTKTRIPDPDPTMLPSHFGFALPTSQYCSVQTLKRAAGRKFYKMARVLLERHVCSRFRTMDQGVEMMKGFGRKCCCLSHIAY